METNGVEIKILKGCHYLQPQFRQADFCEHALKSARFKAPPDGDYWPEQVELTELREFKKLTDWADKIKEEKYDWVIVAGGDGTLRAMIAELDRNGYVPYISVFPAAR